MNTQNAQVANSTIAVLLVLAILVSAIGTWTVLQKVKDLNVNAGPTGLAAGNAAEEPASAAPAFPAAAAITGGVVDETGYNRTEPVRG